MAGHALFYNRRPKPSRRSSRRLYLVIGAAAAGVALLAVALQSWTAPDRQTTERLAVKPTHPRAAASATPGRHPTASASPTSVATHALAGPAPTVPGAAEVRGPSAPKPVAPPPLRVSVHVSPTTVPYGGHVTVSYSWSDGNAPLLDINHVESTAVSYTRPGPCQRHAGSATHPHQGQGSYVFTWNDPGLTAGVHFPLTGPQRIKVGVDVRTGASCIPVEERTATVWVTLLPPPAATPAASMTPTPDPTSSP